MFVIFEPSNSAYLIITKMKTSTQYILFVAGFATVIVLACVFFSHLNAQGIINTNLAH